MKKKICRRDPDFIVADHGFDLGIWNASVRNAVNDRLKIGSAAGYQNCQL